MEVLRSYVVRVYRQESDGIAGVVESVETGELSRFRSARELWASVSHPVLTRRPPSSDIKDQEEGK